MAEAPEHIFLTHKFVEILDDFSKLKLYGYREADRKKFDFACVLQRDWARPLIGQTLWKHNEGIDKDIRTMLSETESDIWTYVARDNIKNRATLYEVVQDFRRSKYKDDLFKLKILWVPQDFDADKETDRETIGNILQSTIVEDILFNVVFGNLSADDIRFFLNASGIPGLNLAVLYGVATGGFINYPDLSKRLQVSSGPLRERILNLTGTGFLWQVNASSMFYVSLKGRVFLELLYKISSAFSQQNFTPELCYVLSKLDIEPTIPTEQDVILSITRRNSQDKFFLLLHQIDSAIEQWNIELSKKTYEINKLENDPQVRIMR